MSVTGRERYERRLESARMQLSNVRRLKEDFALEESQLEEQIEHYEEQLQIIDNEKSQIKQVKNDTHEEKLRA